MVYVHDFHKPERLKQKPAFLYWQSQAVFFALLDTRVSNECLSVSTISHSEAFLLKLRFDEPDDSLTKGRVGFYRTIEPVGDFTRDKGEATKRTRIF